MKPKLKPPESERLKLKCDTRLSISAFKLNVRRYTELVSETQEHHVIKISVRDTGIGIPVGRCKLTPG